MVRFGGARLVLGDPGWHHTAPREVEIDPFWIGTHEVTRGEFARFAAEAGQQRGELLEPANLPMTGIDWDRAVEYANWLAGRTGRPYRLPTSDEWEAAARSGFVRAFEWGDDEPPWPVRANLADQSARRVFGVTAGRELFPLAELGYEDGFAGLAPVGSFAPNRSGIYDLTGNAMEWCSDAYLSDVEAGTGAFRAVRGSSFMTRRVSDVRIGWVIALPASTRHIALGFRLAHSG